MTTPFIPFADDGSCLEELDKYMLDLAQLRQVLKGMYTFATWAPPALPSGKVKTDFLTNRFFERIVDHIARPADPRLPCACVVGEEDKVFQLNAAIFLDRKDIVDQALAAIPETTSRNIIKTPSCLWRASPLALAVKVSDYRTVESMLDKYSEHGGFNPDVFGYLGSEFESRDLLHDAIRKGDMDLVQLFMRPRYLRKRTGQSPRKALACAIQNGELNIAKFLIKSLEDLKERGLRTLGPEVVKDAIRMGSWTVMEALLEHAGIEPFEVRFIILDAIRQSKFFIVRGIWRDGFELGEAVNLNRPNVFTNFPYYTNMLAGVACSGNVQFFDWIRDREREAGRKCEADDKFCVLALGHGHLDLLWRVYRGPTVQIRRREAGMCLMLQACKDGDIETVISLYNGVEGEKVAVWGVGGAYINVLRSPWEVARDYGHEEVADWIKEICKKKKNWNLRRMLSRGQRERLERWKQAEREGRWWPSPLANMEGDMGCRVPGCGKYIHISGFFGGIIANGS